MGRGGGGKGAYGPKKSHRGHGSRVGRDDEVIARNQEGSVQSQSTVIEESSEEDGSDDGLFEKVAPVPKKKAGLERDDDLEKELAAQFQTTTLTRKQKEELEAQRKANEEEAARKAGTSDQAKAELEKLAEVKARRAEAAQKKIEEAEAAKKKEEEDTGKVTAEATEKIREVASAIAALCKDGKDGTITINQLNQDAKCKKILKPLLKKHNVKALNKAWMEKFPDILKLAEENNVVNIQAV